MFRKVCRSAWMAGLWLVGGLAPLSADTLSTMPIDTLKRAYLDCEVAAQAARLAGGDVAACSSIYETLKASAFGGDSRALRDWYHGRVPRDLPMGQGRRPAAPPVAVAGTVRCGQTRI